MVILYKVHVNFILPLHKVYLFSVEGWLQFVVAVELAIAISTCQRNYD